MTRESRKDILKREMSRIAETMEKQGFRHVSFRLLSVPRHGADEPPRVAYNYTKLFTHKEHTAFQKAAQGTQFTEAYPVPEVGLSARIRRKKAVQTETLGKTDPKSSGVK